MIAWLYVLQLALVLASAIALCATAVRREEWRGGLLALACVFVAVAVNVCESLTEGFPTFGLPEPELMPIMISLVVAVACMWIWRGSTVTAFAAIYCNRRFPLLVMGILFVSLLPNIARNKHVWSMLVPEMTDVRLLRELAQEMTKSFGHILLVAWAVLFLKDKRRTPSRRPSPHEHLLWTCPLIRVGWGGTRRVCFKLGDSGFCVKFYKPAEDCASGKMKRSIRREIGWRRFNKYRNCSSEEVYVYQLTRNTMPPEMRNRLPEVCERVFHHEYGWGVLETFYANPDGSAIIPYEFEIERQKSRPDIQRSIYIQARDFLMLLIRHKAYFYEPGNFHVHFDAAGTPTLKLVDFEPESKSFLPLELVFSPFRAEKLRRKARRYLRHIRERYNVDVKVETEIG